jgi:hypothetical protein
MSAPGQPPSKLNKCNVLSVVRQRLSLAEDLSQPYARKVIPLPTEYNQRTKTGNLPAKTAPDTETMNVAANSSDLATSTGADAQLIRGHPLIEDRRNGRLRRKGSSELWDGICHRPGMTCPDANGPTIVKQIRTANRDSELFLSFQL